MVTRTTRLRSAAGYTLLEMLIAMGVMTVVMAATLGGLSNATKANDAVLNVTGMNGSIRAGMDLLVRDMLQVGSGLPPSHVITIPSGAGSGLVRVPGPPCAGSPCVPVTLTLPAGDLDIGGVVPLPGAGPTVNGTATDVVVTLMADNTFLNVPITAHTATTITVGAGPNLLTGPDVVVPGQLMMVMKGTVTTLLQVTGVNQASRVLTFADGDSLNLNQSAAAAGNLPALIAADPPDLPSAVNITRVRMVTYYIDAKTVPSHPRLVRRINNGLASSPTGVAPTYDNDLGTAVALDIENLQFTYDLAATGNPANVKMNAADRGGTGACNPNACMEAQIRKVNIAVTGRSQDANNERNYAFRNTLVSQVSFRGMAFVDRYR